MKKSTLLLLLLFGMATSAIGQASLCEDAVSVTLPYSTTDNTANYGNNYLGTPGISGCGTPNNFLGGNDVVYAYTATFTGSLHVSLSTGSQYVGLFAYGSCADIGEVCLAGTVMEDSNSAGYLSLEAFPVTNGDTYYFVISSWPEPQTVSYHLNIAANTCTNATVTYTVVSDCSLTPQFFVAVAVENLGSATSLTVSDNLGSPTQSVSAEGVVTFGPYANGTAATFTVTNNQDPNCFITSAPQTQSICAPVNNFCSGAIDLNLETSPLNGTTIGSTNQNNVSCSNNTAAGDVYYKILIPNTYTLTIRNIHVDYDAVVTAFFGDCENQIELTCFDDDLAVYNYNNNTGTDQTFYWVQDGFNGQTGSFTLAWSVSSCVVPEALYTIVPDCQNGEQFLVSADVYTLGSAASVTISDDLGSAPQHLTATGQVQFGPYQNGTPVVFTVVNDDDSDCLLSSQEIVQYECPPTCVNATATYGVALNCPDAGFSVNVNVSDLGTATSLTLSDDQGSLNQSVLSIGVYQFGPYPDFSTINFTVADANDSDCVVTTQVQSFTTCPPPNDSCANAIALTPGADFALGSLSTTSQGATVSPELPIPSCGNMFFTSFAKDVWYTVAVPASGSITIETAASGEGGFAIVDDSVLQVYSGSCANLTAIECDHDSGAGLFSKISLTGRTPVELLHIRAFGANGSQGSFKISAYDASLLSDADFDNFGFASFPNPVRDILNLSYTKEITSVRVFNLLGQEVFTKSINASQTQIDMSNLSKGTYLVRVAADSQVKTFKVIKE